MKKLIVILALGAFLLAAAPAIADDCCTGPLDTMDKAFSLEGNPTVGIGDIPWQHDMLFKVTNPDLEEIFWYVLDHGSVDYFAYFFAGLLLVDKYFPDEDVWLNIEDYTRRGEGAYFLLETPYDGTETMVFLEQFNDGDLEVDAVGLRGTDGRIRAIRYMDDEMPNIYSSVFKKMLSKLIHKYAYETPINHATIEMGEPTTEKVEQD